MTGRVARRARRAGKGPPLSTIDAADADRAQPKGLATLFFVELWERFSYYGMRAILVYFMVAPAANGGLGYGVAEAALFYGNYTMAVYLLALPGGYIADRFIGARVAVMAGGLVIAAGHFALAAGGLAAFYIGAVLIALGTGLFKPSISAMVGGLYSRPQDPRRDGGFTLFYMGINIGGLLAPLVTGFLAQSAVFKGWLAGQGFDPAASWHWGFAAAGVGMTFAVLLFAARLSRFAGIGERPRGLQTGWRPTLVVLAGSLVLLALLIASDREPLQWVRYLLAIIPVVAIAIFIRRADEEARRVAAIFVFFIAAMVFWSAFEQAGLSIALFADRLTDPMVFGWSVPSAWFQSLNPLFVIVLAPLFATLWTRLGTRQPSTPIKFALALALLALGFLAMVPAALATAEGRVSPLWLVLYFLLVTMGELCLSPVGLSAMTKLAPLRFVGLILGVWFLAAAFGNKLAGVLGSGYSDADPVQLAWFFARFAGYGAVAALLVLVFTPWLRRQMGGIK
jgi:POT family proton-dependent oligopeptide transporter